MHKQLLMWLLLVTVFKSLNLFAGEVEKTAAAMMANQKSASCLTTGNAAILGDATAQLAAVAASKTKFKAEIAAMEKVYHEEVDAEIAAGSEGISKEGAQGALQEQKTKLYSCLGQQESKTSVGYTTELRTCYDAIQASGQSAASQICGAQSTIDSSKMNWFKDAKTGEVAATRVLATLEQSQLLCNARLYDKADSSSGAASSGLGKPICDRICIFGLDAKAESTSPATAKMYSESERIMTQMRSDCEQKIATVNINIQMQIQAAVNFKQQAASMANAIKIGAAATGGAVAVGMIYKNHQDKEEKKEEKKDAKKQKEEDIKNGVARDVKGEPINCLTPDTYLKTECQPLLMDRCTKPENSTHAGCLAFNKSYCETEGANQSFCLAGSAKSYCASSTVLTESPACAWLQSRPSSCETAREQVTCLTSWSPAQLDEACPQYPSDPLCVAHAAGKVVTQPLANSSSSSLSSTASTSSLNSLVGGGDSTSIWSQNSSSYTSMCSRGLMACGGSK